MAREGKWLAQGHAESQLQSRGLPPAFLAVLPPLACPLAVACWGASLIRLPPLLAFSERVFWSQREQWKLSTGRKIWWRPSEDSTPFPRSSWNSSVSGSETYHLSEVMKGLSPLMAGGFYQVKNSEDTPKLSSNTCEMFQTFPHSPSSPLTWKNIHSASVSVISQHTQDRIVEVFQANEKHLNFGSKVTL